MTRMHFLVRDRGGVACAVRAQEDSLLEAVERTLSAALGPGVKLAGFLTHAQYLEADRQLVLIHDPDSESLAYIFSKGSPKC